MNEQSKSLRCYDAIEIWTDEPKPIREALEVITDDWVEDGHGCQQCVIDLKDACKYLLNVSDAWQWMTDMNCTVRRDADISRANCWWFMDVDEEVIAKGRTPIEAIIKAKHAIEGVHYCVNPMCRSGVVFVPSGEDFEAKACEACNRAKLG